MCLGISGEQASEARGGQRTVLEHTLRRTNSDSGGEAGKGVADPSGTQLQARKAGRKGGTAEVQKTRKKPGWRKPSVPTLS